MNEAFYLKQSEPNKSCFLAMRDLVATSDARLKETVKYGMPCFCLNNKPVCYLWQDKKTNMPYFLFVDGHQMKHPSLETGGRKRMKIFTINPYEDFDLKIINEVLCEMKMCLENRGK